MSLDVIKKVAKYKNICNYIHLPVQSGSDKILKLMNRQHTIKDYLKLIDNINNEIPNCGISHDMIVGFPNETESDHEETLKLMDKVKYSFGYMFKYSERPGTLAAKKFDDNVDEIAKSRRLSEIISLQQKHSLFRNKQYMNDVVEVLIEKESKSQNLIGLDVINKIPLLYFPKKIIKLEIL